MRRFGSYAANERSEGKIRRVVWKRYRTVRESFLKDPKKNRLYIASSVTEETIVANSDERLRLILAKLEKCRAALFESASPETAQMVSLAILELRMKLNHIPDSELKALCDAMVPGPALAEEAPSHKDRHPGTPLKLVK